MDLGLLTAFDTRSGSIGLRAIRRCEKNCSRVILSYCIDRQQEAALPVSEDDEAFVAVEHPCHSHQLYYLFRLLTSAAYYFERCKKIQASKYRGMSVLVRWGRILIVSHTSAVRIRCK